MESIQRTPGRSRRLLYLLLTWNIVVESIKKKFYEQGLLNSHSKMTYKKYYFLFLGKEKKCVHFTLRVKKFHVIHPAHKTPLPPSISTLLKA